MRVLVLDWEVRTESIREGNYHMRLSSLRRLERRKRLKTLLTDRGHHVDVYNSLKGMEKAGKRLEDYDTAVIHPWKGDFPTIAEYILRTGMRAVLNSDCPQTNLIYQPSDSVRDVILDPNSSMISYTGRDVEELCDLLEGKKGKK